MLECCECGTVNDWQCQQVHQSQDTVPGRSRHERVLTEGLYDYADYFNASINPASAAYMPTGKVRCKRCVVRGAS